jgi:hypothetical protein
MATARLLYYAEDFEQVYGCLKKYDPGVADQWRQTNNSNMTPLQIAAANADGNFGAMMHCQRTVQWQFGGVLCTAHPLAGWDSAHSRQFQENEHHLVDEEKEEVSALEFAVLSGNYHFFSVPLNQLLVKSKWTLFVCKEYWNRCLYFSLFVVLATASACVHDGLRVAIFLRLWTFFLAAFMLAYYMWTSCRVIRTAYFRQTPGLFRKGYLIDAQKICATMLVLCGISLQAYADVHARGSDHHRFITGLLYGYMLPLSLIVSWLCTAELLLLREDLSRILLVIVDIVRIEMPVWLLLQSMLLSAFTAAIYIATAKVYDEHHLTFSVFGSFIQTGFSLALVPLGGIANVEELLASEHDVVVCTLYWFYSALSCVLFLNLTISLFTDRTKTILNNAGKMYAYLLAMQCIADEKRRHPASVRKYWIGSKLGSGERHLIVQKFPKQDDNCEGEQPELSEEEKMAKCLREALAEERRMAFVETNGLGFIKK